MDILISGFSTDLLADDSERAYWYATRYSSDLLALYNRANFQPKFKNDDRIKNDLLVLVTKEKGGFSLDERIAAADTLDELGYIPTDLYDFIKVPDREFYISKYPVTNVQYERFLKQVNFAQKNYWIDFPKFDKNNRVAQSETWGGDGWIWLQDMLRDRENCLVENGVLLPLCWRDPRFGLMRRTAPVVGISWHEASAYCKWLSGNWRDLPEKGSLSLFASTSSKLTFRLPLVVEWEFAAGGIDPDVRFAWGTLKDEKEIIHFTNTSENGFNRTTPVWMYPQGAGPYGSMDMSGNVLEWLADIERIDEDKQAHQLSYLMAMRGGSWKQNNINAQIAYPMSYYQGVRYNYFGFRILAYATDD